MLRTEAAIRTSKHEDLRVYDIFHVWPNGHVASQTDVVRWSSHVFVYLADPYYTNAAGEKKDATKDPVRVRLWAPGGIAGQPKDLRWGEEWHVPSGGFGIVSVVADHDAPLHVFWELSAGKA